MKRKLLLLVSIVLLASNLISCTHERHHRDEHKKYRVIKEDSTQKVFMEDHMHDNQVH